LIQESYSAAPHPRGSWFVALVPQGKGWGY